MLAILVAQSIFCAFRLVMLLDIMGGFIMGIGVGLGWYAWKEDMHITFICYWGLMSLFNGTMDLIKFIDQWVKSPMPLFSSHLPWKYNLMSLAVMLSPFSLLLGAYLSYYLYKHHSEEDSGIVA